MGDWLLNVPLPAMALLVFVAVSLVAAAVYLVVIGLAVDAQGRAFKALSPGMLPPLGIIFGLSSALSPFRSGTISTAPSSPSRPRRAPFAAS